MTMTTPSMPLLPVEYPEPVVAQMLRRAGSRGYDAWWHRVQWSGFCATPIHLAEVDANGRERVVLGRCNNRRASVCPSCSDLYAGDTWQLIHAGIDGGHHELPATITEHPMVFATLTAPGFGAVHTTHPGATGPGRRCHPDREYRRCPHGRPRWCTAIHHGDDPVLGQPLCVTATTTVPTCCSPGTPRNCGDASRSPCDACSADTCGQSGKPPTGYVCHS